jgi:hypothetical protein
MFLCACTKEEDTPIQTNIVSGNEPNFIEPEVKKGRYYLNGDVSQYYFEVTEDTVELCGVDLSELFDSWQSYNSDDSISEELAEKRKQVKEEWIEKWSGPKQYEVKTQSDGKTLLATKTITTPEGFVVSSGLIIKDDKTLTGFGKDGDFILVE